MSEEKQRLLARKEKIEQRLAAIQEAGRRRREKDEKRKAELAGRAVLRRAAKDERFAAELRAILDAEIAAAAARALFGLAFGASSSARSRRPAPATRDRQRRPRRSRIPEQATAHERCDGCDFRGALARRAGRCPRQMQPASASFQHPSTSPHRGAFATIPPSCSLASSALPSSARLPASASRRAALKSASAMTATPLRSRAAARARAGRRSSPTCCAIRARCSRSIPRASSRSRPRSSRKQARAARGVVDPFDTTKRCSRKIACGFQPHSFMIPLSGRR